MADEQDETKALAKWLAETYQLAEAAKLRQWLADGDKKGLPLDEGQRIKISRQALLTAVEWQQKEADASLAPLVDEFAARLKPRKPVIAVPTYVSSGRMRRP